MASPCRLSASALKGLRVEALPPRCLGAATPKGLRGAAPGAFQVDLDHSTPRSSHGGKTPGPCCFTPRSTAAARFASAMSVHEDGEEVVTRTASNQSSFASESVEAYPRLLGRVGAVRAKITAVPGGCASFDDEEPSADDFAEAARAVFLARQGHINSRWLPKQC